MSSFGKFAFYLRFRVALKIKEKAKKCLYVKRIHIETTAQTSKNVHTKHRMAFLHDDSAANFHFRSNFFLFLLIIKIFHLENYDIAYQQDIGGILMSLTIRITMMPEKWP